MSLKVRRAFESLTFDFDGDNAARLELEKRLAETGRREDLITYSSLVRGILFHLPNVQGGAQFELGVPDWTDLHRAVIGSNLGRISRDSYLAGGFLASAIAVSKADFSPSEGFRELVDQVGLLTSAGPDAFLKFWSTEVARAYAWYKSHPDYPES